MKRKFLCMALSVILTSAALCGCNKAGGADRAEAAHEREPLTIWTATDIHYLSPELTDDGELFRKVIADGDAKLTEYSQEIVDEFLREVIEACARLLKSLKLCRRRAFPCSLSRAITI